MAWVFFFVSFFFFLFFFLFFELETIEVWFFQSVQSLFRNFFTNFVNIRWSFFIDGKQIYNSLTVHDNSGTWNSTIFLNFKMSLVIATHPHSQPQASSWHIAYENWYVTNHQYLDIFQFLFKFKVGLSRFTKFLPD